jgi:uncharacterized Zn finger protein (UPF0148 family)
MKENKISFYFCPRCKSANIWELDDKIYCPICSLTYEKKGIQQFLEDVLSIEEKKLMVYAFEKEGIDTKKFFKFLSE